MERVAHKSLPLILAREFASNLATPMLIADADGNLVFFNEPAERILGRTYAELGELAADEWDNLFPLESLDGGPLPPEQRPVESARTEQRPTHQAFVVAGLDGRRHEIAATAVPLLAREGELVGVVAVFWERRDR